MSMSKGKAPWITLNGEDVMDSQVCLEHMAKHFGKDLSADLTPEQKAIQKGIRAILEDNLYFCMVMQRWAFDDDEHLLKTLFVT